MLRFFKILSIVVGTIVVAIVAGVVLLLHETSALTRTGSALPVIPAQAGIHDKHHAANGFLLAQE